MFVYYGSSEHNLLLLLMMLNLSNELKMAKFELKNWLENIEKKYFCGI